MRLFIYLFIYNIRRHARRIQYWANNKLKDCLKKKKKKKKKTHTHTHIKTKKQEKKVHQKVQKHAKQTEEAK